MTQQAQPDHPRRRRRRKPFVSTAERIKREARADGARDALIDVLRSLLHQRCGGRASLPAKLLPHLDGVELASWVDRFLAAADPASLLREMRSDSRNEMGPSRPPEREFDSALRDDDPHPVVASLHRAVRQIFDEGYWEGQLDALRNVLYRSLHQRFGPTPERVLAPIRHADVDQLQEWIDRFVEAESDEEVVAFED